MGLEVEERLMQIAYAVSKMEGLYRRIAVKSDLPGADVQVLYLLYFNEYVTQKEIIELSETPKQTINNVIRKLKNEQYISLTTCNTDKRQKYISLTPAGKEYCQKVLQPFFQINEKVAERVGDDLTKDLLAKLSKLCKALEIEIEIAGITEKWEE